MKNKKREYLISNVKHDNDKIHPIIKQIDHFKIPHSLNTVIIISFNFYKTHNLMKVNTVPNNSKKCELLGTPSFKIISDAYYTNNKTYYSNNKRNYYVKNLKNTSNVILKSLSNKYNHIKTKKIINSVSFCERIDSLYVSPLFRLKFILDDELFSPNNIGLDYFINVSIIRTNKVLVRYIMYMLGIKDVEILLEFLNKKYDKTNYKIFFKNCNIRNNTVQYHIRYIVTKNKLVKKVIKIDVLLALLSFLRKEHNIFIEQKIKNEK